MFAGSRPAVVQFLRSDPLCIRISIEIRLYADQTKEVQYHRCFTLSRNFRKHISKYFPPPTPVRRNSISGFSRRKEHNILKIPDRKKKPGFPREPQNFEYATSSHERTGQATSWRRKSAAEAAALGAEVEGRAPRPTRAYDRKDGATVGAAPCGRPGLHRLGIDLLAG